MSEQLQQALNYDAENIATSDIDELADMQADVEENGDISEYDH